MRVRGSTVLAVARVVVCLALLASCAKTSGPSEAARIEFETKFASWKTAVQENPDLRFSSRTDVFTSLKEYGDIIKMGTAAVPFIVEKLEAGDFILVKAMEEIEGFVPYDSVGMGEQEKSAIWVKLWKDRDKRIRPRTR